MSTGPAASAAGGCGAAPACVVVDVVGTTTTSQTFTPDDLDRLHDIVNTTYTLQSRPNDPAPQTTNVAEATSLRALVAAIPDPGHPGSTLDPDAVTFTEVDDAQGHSHPLPRGALGASGATGYQRGLMPVVYALDQDTIGFLRPLRDSSDVNVSADVNIGGYFLSGTDGVLHIVVHTSGQLLAPVIHASATSADVGKGVGFTVTLPRRPAGQLTYAWDFGDGSTSTVAAPTHAWAHTGTYEVDLTVSSPDGSTGRAESVLVDVAAVPKSGPSTGPGTGKDKDKHAPVTGPTTSKGGHKGGQVSDTPTTGTVVSGGSTAGAEPTAAATGAASEAGVLPPPAVPSIPVAKPTRTAPVRAADDGAVEVSGIVLAAAEVAAPPAVDEPATAHAARRTASSTPFSLPGWVLPTLAVLLVFGAGVAGELRPYLGPRLRRRPARTGRMRP